MRGKRKDCPGQIGIANLYTIYFLSSSQFPIGLRLWLAFLDWPCMGAVFQSKASPFLGQHRMMLY